MLEAEKIAKKRLDRRKIYATTDDGKPCEYTDGLIFIISTGTTVCSGCSCDTEYGCSCCVEKGSGCPECGYTGKRRHSTWIPLFF